MNSENSLLRGLRVVLVNPHLFPIDLRGELQSAEDGNKHESGMNFGILIIANSLIRAGAEVEIVDLQAKHKDWRAALQAAITRGPTRIVGVGSLSVYSFLPLVDILRTVKELDSSLCTVAGGQNAQNLPLLLDKAGAAALLDYLVCGDGEEATINLFHCIKESRAVKIQGVSRPAETGAANPGFTSRVALDENNSLLDYSIYPGFRGLWPVIEESRGCPFKCDFCANPLQGGASIRIKSPELLLREVQHLYNSYGATGSLPTVLMTSIYGVHSEIASRFFKLLKQTDLEPRFVASTRVDLNHKNFLADGARYFDQMHFGLESGAESVISRMVKTTSAKRYLAEAQDNLARWSDHGVHTGINFIVGYLGESKDTIEESIKWLGRNKGSISSVWGGGLMAYPDSPFSRSFHRFEKLYGASYEEVSPFCSKLHTWPINPSSDLRYKEVQEYVEHIHDLFYEADNFYHHYKWYVGPQSREGNLGFLNKTDFDRKFSLSSRPTNLS